MKKTIFTAICMLICFSGFSQTEEEMKAWQSNMTPGKYHKWLASMNGEWDATVTLWMDPSQPAEVSEATSSNEMIMNGLYQRSSHKGTMMGMPFMGESITGYDNAKQKFLATWIDNFGSSIMLMEGNYDDSNNTLTLDGKMMDPASGKDLVMKQTLTKISEDEHKFVMYMVADDIEVKTMEIIYKRTK